MPNDDLNKSYQNFVQIRRANIALIDSIAPALLPVIPPGFSNNIYWQAGHLVAVQSSLLYRRSNQPMPIDETWMRYFAKATSPSDFDDNIPSFELVREALESCLLSTEHDLDQLALWTYPESISVSTGHRISSSADAMDFLSIHEAVHLGMMTAMKKYLR